MEIATFDGVKLAGILCVGLILGIIAAIIVGKVLPIIKRIVNCYKDDDDAHDS